MIETVHVICYRVQNQSCVRAAGATSHVAHSCVSIQVFHKLKAVFLQFRQRLPTVYLAFCECFK